MSNEREIERLIKTYGNDVLRIANIYMKDSFKAEDVFQDVFLKVYEKLNGFKKESSEKTWIIRITINTCKDYLKQAYNKKVVNIDEAMDFNKGYEANVEEKVDKGETKKSIVKQILSLPIKYRDVLILYYYQEFSTGEISYILKVPEATVRTRMKRAREIMKDKIQIEIEDD